MKNSLIIIVLNLLLFSSVCYSQNKIELGVRFIPQATTFRYTLGIPGVSPVLDYLKLSPYYFRVRTAQGIGILYNPVQRIRLGADLLYSLQGGGYKERKTNLNYLTLPLWLGVNSKAKRRIIFTLQTGIQFSCLLSAKNKYTDGTSVNINHYVSRTSWGIPIAIGVKFKILHQYFITTQLYIYSDFSSIAKTNKQFGAYNYVYPGLRVSIDQSLVNFKKGK